MGLFGDDEGVPDVGQEDAILKKPKKKGILESLIGKKKPKEEPKESEEGDGESGDVAIEEEKYPDGVTDVEPEPEEEVKPKKKNLSKEDLKNESSGLESFEFERFQAKMEAMDSLIRSYGERFATVSQQIGEVRAMTLSNEKEISKAIEKSEMAADIVKEVEPEKLRVDYQKIDLKFNSLSERIETNKQFSDSILEQLKDLKRRADAFVGTQGVLDLNEEVKKDLIELQQMAGKVRMHADKAEDLFMELKRGFAENQKLNEIVANLDANYSDISKEVAKTKMDFSNIVPMSELDSFKRTMTNKFAAIEESVAHVETFKEEIEKISQLIETVAGVAKKNKEDIADIAITIGDDKIQRVADYENQIASILSIIDSLAGQINLIKKKVKIKGGISVKHNEDVVGDKVNMENVEVHDKISENLTPKPVENSLENVGAGEEGEQMDKLLEEHIRFRKSKKKNNKNVKNKAAKHSKKKSNSKKQKKSGKKKKK
jgi:hypothetical protein